MGFNDVSTEMEDELYKDLYTEEEFIDPDLIPEGFEDPDEGDYFIDEPSSNFEKTKKSKEPIFEHEDEEEDPKELVFESDSEILEAFLKAKGIEDLNKIQFEDEDGNIQEVSFYDLPAEEQLEILKSSDADINYGLSDEETETINFLRSNNASLKELIEYVRRDAVEEYLRSSVSEQFSVDTMSDEELFVLDLKTKFEDLTEEDLQIELDKELNNPDLFKKKINKIRQEYIELEAEKIEADTRATLDDENNKYEELTSKLVNVAVEIEDIGGLDLTDDDKNDVLDFILTKDVNGVSNFVKNLDDNKMLFKMAWFAVKGEEAFDILHDYYKNQIDQVRKTTYQKVQKDFEQKQKTNTIVPSKTTNTKGTFGNRSGGMNTIDDLY